MQYIKTCLWFDIQGEEAARFYCSILKDGQIERTIPYGKAASHASGQPEGSVMTVDFTIGNLPFMALNGGPHFRFNPSISFVVGCESEAEMEKLWTKLGQSVRMELATYPFARKYGWCEDRFGVNWQLIWGPDRQRISPALLFSNQKYGKAEEAIHFYMSNFPNSRVLSIAKDEKTKAVLHARLLLSGHEFVIMEGPIDPATAFSPAVSFVLGCDSQEEIDVMWDQLSADPENEQCGWLTDRYGVSWQVVPKDLGKMLFEEDPVTRERLMSAILGMKKIEILRLRR